MLANVLHWLFLLGLLDFHKVFGYNGDVVDKYPVASI